ncbi:MAG TPA: SRPBCC family protein [Actinomycetota bacterium]|nr:SRPBCC family protein [Actinomycetota bacterium]
MKTFQAKTTIKAPAERVFGYVSDFSHHADWSGHGLTVTKEGDGPVAVGTTYATEAKQFGTQREHSTITELSPNSAFAWDSTGALGTVHHSFALAESDGSTSVTKAAELTKPSFLAKLTSWKLSKDIPKGLESDLAKIKVRLEAPGSS